MRQSVESHRHDMHHGWGFLFVKETRTMMSFSTVTSMRVKVLLYTRISPTPRNPASTRSLSLISLVVGLYMNDWNEELGSPLEKWK